MRANSEADGRAESVPSPEKANVIVDVSSVSRTYRVRDAGRRNVSFTAVDDVSFTVSRGGSLGIVGESGSGKTTLARMIVGLEHPTTGSIVVDGVSMDGRARTRAARRVRGQTVQMVYQDPDSSLDPRQTVGDSLDEVLRFCFKLSSGARRARTIELLEQVGLSQSHLTLRPNVLSGGQRQRVAIARALACAPSLLVLDEAVSALDVSVQGQVLNLLADMRSELDVSYVFISHDLAVVQQISDEIIVMHNGKVVERGRTEQVLNKPNDEYTQRLIEAVPTVGWKPHRHVVG